MLNIFTLANGRLFQEEIESLAELSQFQPIWVDLESPTLEEKRWVKQYYGLSIPEDAMDEDIEESARFYAEDNGELHIRSDFLIADDHEPRTVRVAFILNLVNDELKSKGVLFSIHDEDVPVFRLLRMRARRAPGLIEDAKEVLRFKHDGKGPVFTSCCPAWINLVEQRAPELIPNISTAKSPTGMICTAIKRFWAKEQGISI